MSWRSGPVQTLQNVSIYGDFGGPVRCSPPQTLPRATKQELLTRMSSLAFLVTELQVFSRVLRLVLQLIAHISVFGKRNEKKTSRDTRGGYSVRPRCF